ncbi:MAG: peptidase, partial [Acidobacteriota bacterium]
MARKRSKGKAPKRDPAAENFDRAVHGLREHPLFSPLIDAASVSRQPGTCPQDAHAILTSSGYIYANAERLEDPPVWMWILAHHLLHLGFGHVVERAHHDVWNFACDAVVNRFLADLKLGRPPSGTFVPETLPKPRENELYDFFVDHGVPPRYRWGGTAGPRCDLIMEPVLDYRRAGFTDRMQETFTLGLRSAVHSAVELAGGAAPGAAV